MFQFPSMRSMLTGTPLEPARVLVTSQTSWARRHASWPSVKIRVLFRVYAVSSQARSIPKGRASKPDFLPPVTYSAPSRAVREHFFQGEDGIRDIGVTGVQTCALPI